MSRGSPFVFYDSVEQLPDGMRAHVGAGITTQDELYDEMSVALHLPDWFGRNWNALNDVLNDLSWIAPRGVVIVHEDLPELPTEELLVYLDILQSAVVEWARRPGAHELVVAFPDAEQLAIRRLLADIPA